MDDYLGRQHEDEVLQAFDRVAGEFRAITEEAEGESPLTEIDGSAGVAAASYAAEQPLVGRSARNAGTRSKKTAKPQKETKPETRKPAEKKPKKKKKKKGGAGKVILGILLFLLFAGVVAAGVAGYYVMGIIKEAPEINPDNLYDLLSENSVVYDADGNILDNLYSGDSLRSNLEYSDIPKDLINAFVSIEDKTFWDHHGFNVVRIIGAIRDALKYDTKISGTSTITQQLARNLYLPDVKSVRSMNRKIIEAYYTMIIEKNLTKEQIIEAYMNTINLGFNSSGVQAAAQAYFSKDAQDLDLIECACLATLPQLPSAYAPIKRIATADVDDPDALDIIERSDEYITYYNDACVDRMKLVLRAMHEQGYINDLQYETIDPASLREHINPGSNAMADAGVTSYFTDCAVQQVREDLMRELSLSEDEADRMLYNGGLCINTTMNREIQEIMEAVWADNSGWPTISGYRTDKSGNIIGDNGKLMLYSKSVMFDDDGDFVLETDEFEWQGNGDLKLLADKRLNFFKTTGSKGTDYSIEFKSMYEKSEGLLYSIEGGSWAIASEYKTRDDNGDMIISKQFFTDHPDVIHKLEDGRLYITSDYFSLRKPTIQPQSAMVIMDHRTGYVLGMIGGRNVEGKLLYNRATAPRQPGSSIKPISIYSTALQAGADGKGDFTAAMPLDDRPVVLGGKAWPKNWYTGYWGIKNMRYCIEQSINTTAVQCYLQMDPQWCVDQLQAMGITSIVENGAVNDMNASALALGGMTKGISPLEMCGAYATFGNYGVYTEPCFYTTVTTKKGDIVLNKEPITRRVMSEEVASIMLDMLRTTVTNGLSSNAKIACQPSAGKTGTTSDNFDLWFCGLTPQLTGTVWMGNDVNISMREYSGIAAKMWAKVMKDVGAMYERGEFEMRGDIVRATVDKYSGKTGFSGGETVSEYFVKGTVQGGAEEFHRECIICAETGYLATPDCPHTATKVGIVRPGGNSWEKVIVESGLRSLSVNAEPDAKLDAPDYYCPVHNPNPAAYPVSPLYNGESPYESVEPDEPDEPEDPENPEGTDEPEGPDVTQYDPNNPDYIPGITDPSQYKPPETTPTEPEPAEPEPTEPQQPSEGGETGGEAGGESGGETGGEPSAGGEDSGTETPESGGE
ncbi:MAG: transglycosylase domain-containing protein [Firmicutes bacterium]|nr:transglycosylase domain-containing protein [Bacillota bacterium]